MERRVRLDFYPFSNVVVFCRLQSMRSPRGAHVTKGAGVFATPQLLPPLRMAEYKSDARVRVVFKATRNSFSLVC